MNFYLGVALSEYQLTITVTIFYQGSLIQSQWGQYVQCILTLIKHYAAIELPLCQLNPFNWTNIGWLMVTNEWWVRPVSCYDKLSDDKTRKNTLLLCMSIKRSTVSRLMIIGLRWNIVVIWWTKRPYIIVSIHGIIIQLFFSCNSPGVGCGGGGSVKYWLALFNNHSNHNLVVFQDNTYMWPAPAKAGFWEKN